MIAIFIYIWYIYIYIYDIYTSLYFLKFNFYQSVKNTQQSFHWTILK